MSAVPHTLPASMRYSNRQRFALGLALATSSDAPIARLTLAASKVADRRDVNDPNRAKALGLAVGLVASGALTQVEAARLAGVDRMTLRRYMGQRTSADHVPYR